MEFHLWKQGNIYYYCLPAEKVFHTTGLTNKRKAQDLVHVLIKRAKINISGVKLTSVSPLGLIEETQGGIARTIERVKQEVEYEKEQLRTEFGIGKEGGF